MALVLLALGMAGCANVVTDTGAELTTAQLEYRLDAAYEVFYCDPDYWPVARGDEQERALAQFPVIAADAERFSAILAHLGLTGTTELTPEQKLAIYRESKRLDSIVLEPDGERYAFQLRARRGGKYYNVSGTITATGRIAAEHLQPGSNMCPICLTADTRIATARGSESVKSLRPGDLVWSLDAAGERVLVPVLRTARVPLRGAVPLLRLRLASGRELLAAGAHPTSTGARLQDLRPGAELDGGRIESVRLRYLRIEATYDLLPASVTGAYWANGVLLGSTLK
jgi:hypothetical protein